MKIPYEIKDGFSGQQFILPNKDARYFIHKKNLFQRGFAYKGLVYTYTEDAGVRL